MAHRKAEECASMDHVRVEIDRIDEALSTLSPNASAMSTGLGN